MPYVLSHANDWSGTDQPTSSVRMAKRAKSVGLLAFGDSLTAGFYAGGGKFNPYTNKLQKIVQKGHPSWKRAKFESYGGCGNSNCVRMPCAAHRRHCKLQEKRFSIWQSLNDSRNYWQRPVLRKRCRASS